MIWAAWIQAAAAVVAASATVVIACVAFRELAVPQFEFVPDCEKHMVDIYPAEGTSNRRRPPNEIEVSAFDFDEQGRLIRWLDRVTLNPSPVDVQILHYRILIPEKEDYIIRSVDLNRSSRGSAL